MELIDREEVIKKIAEQWEYEDEKGLNRDYEYFYECAEIWLEDIPTIESRPKGKWVKYKGEIYGLECSVCGKPAPLESEYGAYPCEKTNYCPNCGADMRGEE